MDFDWFVGLAGCGGVVVSVIVYVGGCFAGGEAVAVAETCAAEDGECGF